ncbi:hypothetical protein Pmani_038623 [Petrolisthes manimaculis]|uniref:Uncharacterized protein n=1 Tax=Petrolisthes manimaculis TaxID=1843537 RepID=A0AAE1NFS6_9EUCA|nr:hypothetical protein Pmani_038623 [Petrolisthes manimaculis]
MEIRVLVATLDFPCVETLEKVTREWYLEMGAVGWGFDSTGTQYSTVHHATTSSGAGVQGVWKGPAGNTVEAGREEEEEEGREELPVPGGNG